MNYDVTIIGAGIVGLSVAMQLAEKHPSLKLCLLEKEAGVAKHQTGRNSGVIHSGIYYKPGSLKAKSCQEGVKLLKEFCHKHNIKYEICGKIIIATNEKQLSALKNLYDRGLQNGLQNIKFISKDEIKKLEPNVIAIRGLHVPYTGIIDYEEVSKAFAKVFESLGGKIYLNTKVLKVFKSNRELCLKTNNQDFHCTNLINCAGLYSDKIARLCSINPKLKIIPFRGEYFELGEKANSLVNNLVYPVPDPDFPFLGVHFTRMIDGSREVGPNAVFAFKREGYFKTDINIHETLETLFYPAFWRMGIKYWRMGLSEMYRSYCKKAFLREAQKMIPAITINDLHAAPAGIRAQALDDNGNLADDFRIISNEHEVHVLNAPSPAATASLAIGKEIVEMASRSFGL